MDAFRKNLLKKLGADSLCKIEKARIGIAGAGGLGSNCAASLVRVGFKAFMIVDFDVVRFSNLDRQFYFTGQVGMKKTAALKRNLLKIRPDIHCEMVCRRITKRNAFDLFQHCNIVVECFDRAECKSMLVSQLLPRGIPIVSASGLGGIGSSDAITVHKIRDGLIIVGDMKSDIKDFPPLAPRVNVAAAKQADVVLELILSK